MERGSTGLAGGGQVRTLRVKMVLVGSSGVGKSSLALHFSKDEFRSTSSTVGCAYVTQTVYLSDVRLRFEIWDTAGEERYHSITPLYYRGAHAALVVYDISKRETFLRAQLWLRELEKQYVPGMLLVLVGNKEDLSHIRQVTTQEGLSLAEDRGLLFMETSSLSGHQVNKLLLAIAHRVNSMVRGQHHALTDWQESPLVDLQGAHTFNPTPTPSCCSNAGL